MELTPKTRLILKKGLTPLLGFFFSLFFFFFFLPQFNLTSAASYYVNSETGLDANNGTSADTPWLTLDYADEMLSSGDTLNIVAPATVPYRNGFNPSVGGADADHKITYTGTSSSSRAYLLGSVDVSQGSTVTNLLENGGVEAWKSSSALWGIVTSGDPIAKSTDAHSGTYSIKATESSTIIRANWYAYLPASTSVTLTYWHKDSSTSYRWVFQVYDPAQNYLQADGSWAAAPGYNHDPNDGSTSWHSYSKTFTTNTEGIYRVVFKQTYATTLYLDDVSLSYAVGSTYQWADVDGHDYKKLNISFPFQSYVLTKSSAADWSANGTKALSGVTTASDLATCDSTPSSFYWDSTDGSVYYNPAVGEDITTLHLELSKYRLETSGGKTTGTVHLGVSNLNIKNIQVDVSNWYGIETGASLTGLQLDYVTSNYSGNVNFLTTGGSTVVANDCNGKYSYAEDIFHTNVVGSNFTCNRCLAEYAGDDGFQAATGTMTVNYSISQYNGNQQTIDNNGYSCEGSGTVCNLYNVVAYGNYGAGFSHAATGGGSFTVKNSIAYATTLGSSNDATTAVVHSTFTHTNNIFGGHVAAWVPDATEITGNPLFFNTAGNDFRLTSSSPAINAGVNVSLTLDYLGNVVPQGTTPDIGAYEFLLPAAGSSLAQYKSDGTTSITTGSRTDETTVVLKFSMSSLNASDSLTPQVEVREVGTDFTNSPTNSGSAVAYSGAPVTGTVTVTGLSSGKNYHWQARVNNAAGNGTWGSYGGNAESATDLSVDTPPTISSILFVPNDSGATITWATNENASSKVDYGLTSSYGSSTSETDTGTRVASHSVILSGLTPCTEYHYRVRSKDSVLNETVGSDQILKTGCISGPPVCSSISPGTKTPWLYSAVPQNSESILLSFTGGDGPIDKYVLEFGTKSGEYPYGSTNIGGSETRIYLVKSLLVNTTYYFRVRGENGCAPGSWSNEISAKTNSLISFDQLEIVSSELENKPPEGCQTYLVKSGDTLWSIAEGLLGDGSEYEEIIEQNKDKYPSITTSTIVNGWELKVNCGGDNEPDSESKKYDVKIKIIDVNQNPVVGAKVTLHSKIQEALTNEEGIAEFKEVEFGEHKVEIAYSSFEGEQTVNLNGEVKEFDLKVTIQPKGILQSREFLGLAGFSVTVISILLIMLMKAKREKKN